MIFGVPEYADVEAVRDILKTIQLDSANWNILCLRLGRRHPTNLRARPMKMILDSMDEPLQLIHRCKILKDFEQFKGVCMAFDRTPKQTEHYLHVKRKLNDRISGGEKNLKTGYINNSPTTVKLNCISASNQQTPLDPSTPREGGRFFNNLCQHNV